MSVEYSPFARPKFTAEDFARNDTTGRFDEPAAAIARPRAPIEEPRSFMADADERWRDEAVIGSDPVMEAELNREDEILLDRPVTRESDAPMFAAAPAYATRTKARSASTESKVPKAALIAVPAVVLMAGVGYLALSSGGAEQGIAAKAPGAESAAIAPAAPILAEPTDLAATNPPMNTAPATPPAERVSAPATTARVDSAPTRVARARPAAAPAAAASSAGVDASATLPAAPVPYSGTAQTASPAPAVAAPAPIIVPPPVTAAEPLNPTPPATAPSPEPSMPEATPEIAPPTL